MATIGEGQNTKAIQHLAWLRGDVHCELHTCKDVQSEQMHRAISSEHTPDPLRIDRPHPRNSSSPKDHVSALRGVSIVHVAIVHGPDTPHTDHNGEDDSCESAEGALTCRI